MDRPESQDLEELLRQVDQLLDDNKPQREEEDIDISQFQPDGLDEPEEPMLYRNFSNGYGAQVRNYANGYGTGQNVDQPKQESFIPAYNADFRREQLRDQQERQTKEKPVEAPAPRKPKPKRKKRRGGCGKRLFILVLILAGLAAVVNWMFTPPQSESSIGQRKDDTAAILICGTDKDGTRTDTMMLLYLSGSENQVSLLSLPRDTYTITAAGKTAKLNSAYGRNGCGEEGMEGLLDYVQDILGYRPDGYLLVDFDLVPQLVDLMGGLEFDVPQDMKVDGISLKEGLQQLTGEQVLTLLRYRKGYATADLGRIEVQRQVVQAALEQWLSAGHLLDAVQSLDLIENNSITDLNWRNYLWMAKTALFNLKSFENDTLPGYATMISGGSYYVLYTDRVAELVNTSYNPYQVEITASSLNIAG